MYNLLKHISLVSHLDKQILGVENLHYHLNSQLPDTKSKDSLSEATVIFASRWVIFFRTFYLSMLRLPVSC